MSNCPKYIFKLPPHTRFTLPPTLALGECGFLLFLSFNTFTSILHHDFLLFLRPFLCADPSFCRLRPHPTSPNMSRFPPPRSCFLDPLEEFPLVVPFPETPLLPRFLLPHTHHHVFANDVLSGPGALGLFHETPSTIDMSLPTPNIPVFTVLS